MNKPTYKIFLYLLLILSFQLSCKDEQTIYDSINIATVQVDTNGNKVFLKGQILSSAGNITEHGFFWWPANQEFQNFEGNYLTLGPMDEADTFSSEIKLSSGYYNAAAYVIDSMYLKVGNYINFEVINYNKKQAHN